MDLTAVRSDSLRAKTKAVCGLRLQTTKFLRVMKLTTALILAASLHVAAAGHSQRVSLSVKDATLKTVFVELNRQTGYNFLYTEETLSKAKKVSINLKDATLDEVLKACFEGQPFTYEIVDKTIVIKQKPTSTVDFQPTKFPSQDILRFPIEVKGRIVNEKGEPVVASVMVKGTNNGTSTNANGEFELKGVDDNATLVISGVSIESFEVQVNGRSELVFSVKMKASPLDEIKVIGYGTTTQRLATGNVSKISSQTISKQPITNPLQSLAGRVAGLQIIQGSGLPGTAFNVQIRGRNSIASSNNPLYVV
jgi:TonB-dependent starch-binding outer membrane protein SusC